MTEVSIISAFSAGLFSFLSPCVLPLIPAYISYITDVSVEEIKAGNSKNKIFIRVIIKTLLFILGFSFIFVTLGASITFLGTFISLKFNLFSKLAGLIIILFGLHTTGIISFKWMYKEKRFNLQNISMGFFTPFIIGMAFAFGWTPCIGPILGAILTYASMQGTIKQGIILLSIYSLGLGFPFLLTGIMFNSFLSFYSKIKKHFRLIEILSGTLLIIIGILILSDDLQRISSYLNFKFSI
ncbi:MAG: cytochrome c biogenesis protein CcdA [Candidatus Firestonebacteria bacterium]|nr:cytochrome c biogenesis protein CcdA [Candidatus Firestonebacteria bacterium]